jgi:uncharacterized protein
MALTFPSVTALVTALLGLLAALLAVQVIRNRVRFSVTNGHGDKAPLAQAIRAHSNLTEHAPIALLLLALAESSGAQRGWIVGIGGVLLLARLLSAWGLSRSLEESKPRNAGAAMTILAIVVSSLLILYRLTLAA